MMFVRQFIQHDLARLFIAALAAAIICVIAHFGFSSDDFGVLACISVCWFVVVLASIDVCERVDQ